MNPRYCAIVLCFILAACAPATQPVNPTVAPPTLAPPPTYTPAPTYTPYPTFTPVPTASLPPTNTPKPPTATPEPLSCSAQACIKRIAVGIDGNALNVRIDLSDEKGEVNVGKEPRISGELLIGIYKIKPDGSKIYLIGARVPQKSYMCYVGNDIPGNGEKPGSLCNVIFPMRLLQERVAVGDILWVELPSFDNMGGVLVVQNGIP